MRRSHLFWLALVFCIVSDTPTTADPGDKAGWSLVTDPRHRAFLMWVPEPSGPRVLMLGCLRDAGTFTTMSYAVGERDEIKRARLTLSNGSARFEIDGSITLYPRIEQSSFISDLDVDDQQLKVLGSKLLPVLTGPGDIAITITAEASGDGGYTRTRQIPIAGLASVLEDFRKVCFE